MDIFHQRKICREILARLVNCVRERDRRRKKLCLQKIASKWIKNRFIVFTIANSCGSCDSIAFLLRDLNVYIELELHVMHFSYALFPHSTLKWTRLSEMSMAARIIINFHFLAISSKSFPEKNARVCDTATPIAKTFHEAAESMDKKAFGVISCTVAIN